MTNKQPLFGIHAITSLLQNNPQRINRLCVQSGREDKKITPLLQEAKKHRITIEQLSKQELDHMTNTANHQGVVAFCEASKAYDEADIPSILDQAKGPVLILILDGVQDPHNLGACFRSADAAGVTLMIAPKDKATGITPVVAKVASGAVETVPFVQVTNLARTLEKLKERGIWIYGAAGEAKQTVYQTDLTGHVAIVLGAEGEGLRRLTRERCDGLINIPMRGSVSSLNVSVATGIFLFEIQRQRMKS